MHCDAKFICLYKLQAACEFISCISTTMRRHGMMIWMMIFNIRRREEEEEENRRDERGTRSKSKYTHSLTSIHDYPYWANVQFSQCT